MISKYKNIKYSFKTLIYFFVFTILGRLLLLFKDKKNSKVIKNILIVGRGRSYFKILNNKSFLKKIDTICLVNFSFRDGTKFAEKILNKNIIILTNKFEPIFSPKLILKLNIVEVIIDILEGLESRHTYFANIYGSSITKFPKNYINIQNIKSNTFLKGIIFLIKKYKLKKIYICGLDFYSSDVFGKNYVGNNSGQIKSILRIRGNYQKQFFLQILNKFSNVMFYIHSHAKLKIKRNLKKLKINN